MFVEESGAQLSFQRSKGLSIAIAIRYIHTYITEQIYYCLMSVYSLSTKSTIERPNNLNNNSNCTRQK